MSPEDFALQMSAIHSSIADNGVKTILSLFFVGLLTGFASMFFGESHPNN
jgi:hypothetical protein